MLHQEFNSKSGGRNEVVFYDGRGFPTPHIHHSAELIVADRGSIVITLDGGEIIAHKGEFVLILPDRVHSFELLADSACFVQVFSSDRAPGFFGALGQRTIKEPKITPSDHTCAYWYALFARDRDYLKTDRVHSFDVTPELSPLKLRSGLYAVLSEFLECELCDKRSSYERVSGELISYIIDNCTQNLTLKSVSAHFGYEPHYFSRLLKRASGMNFRQIINRCRIDKAVELLESGDGSISRIAAACGYDCPRTFNRVFLELEGMTPGDFRHRG